MKQAKTKNISSKQNQHVPGAGLRPVLMARCFFHLRSRSLSASPPVSSVLRPLIDGADPSGLTTGLTTLFRIFLACSIAFEISLISLPAPAGQEIPSFFFSYLAQKKVATDLGTSLAILRVFGYSDSGGTCGGGGSGEGSGGDGGDDSGGENDGGCDDDGSGSGGGGGGGGGGNDGCFGGNFSSLQA